MATVMVTIDGKTYRMACEEGQEAHLVELAGRFDRYISHLKSAFGEIGDHRLSVMGGIMVMDEMVELEARLSVMAEELRVLKAAYSNREAQLLHEKQSLATRVEAATERIEQLAAHLLPKNDEINDSERT